MNDEKDVGAIETGYGHGRPEYLVFMEAHLHNGLKWPSALEMRCILMALADVKPNLFEKNAVVQGFSFISNDQALF